MGKRIHGLVAIIAVFVLMGAVALGASNHSEENSIASYGFTRAAGSTTMTAGSTAGNNITTGINTLSTEKTVGCWIEVYDGSKLVANGYVAKSVKLSTAVTASAQYTLKSGYVCMHDCVKFNTKATDITSLQNAETIDQIGLIVNIQ